MKNAPARSTQPYQLNLSEHELLLLLGATAETLEEKRQPYGRADLARLVGLHNRLHLIWGETVPEYAIKDGSVVLALNPDTVIVPAPSKRSRARTSARTDQIEPCASHG